MTDNDDHLVPNSPEGYRPHIHGDHKDVLIDTKDPRWTDAINRAHVAKLTHAQFAHQLAAERARVLAAHQATAAKAAETPAAKPAAPALPYKEMTMAQKLAHYGV